MQEDHRKSEKRVGEGRGFTGAMILRYQKSIVVLLTFVGILLSALLCIALRRSEQVRTRINFENAAKARISVLKYRVKERLEILDWVTSLYASSQKVGRSEFREFTYQNFCEHNEIWSVLWIPRVRDTDRTAYEAAAREEGFADFQFIEGQDLTRTVRAARRKEYFPAYFIEPYKGNEALLGFDLSSNSVLLEAMKSSCDNNKTIVTESVFSKAGNEHKTFIFKPIYDNKKPADSVEDRRVNLNGFILVILEVDSFLNNILAQIEPFEMDIYIHDLSAPQSHCSVGSSLLNRSCVGEPSHGCCSPEMLSRATGLQVTDTLEIANSKWSVLCIPANNFFAVGRTLVPWLSMISGLGLTLLSVAVFQRIIKSREFTERLLRSQQELMIEIADRERAEQALRESEERFALAVRGSNDGLWDWPDVDSNREWWSPRWYELLGYNDGEIEATHSNFLNLLHPDDLDRSKEAARTHFQERTPMDIEFRLRTKSGEYRWFRERGQAVWDENGKALRMSGSIQDIHKQKQAEERIQKEKRFSENLIDSSIDGILAFDDKCCCTIWNPGMERISGIRKEQALDKCVFDVFPFLKKAEENKYFYEALTGRTVVARDRPYILPETEKQGFFEGYYSPLRDETGKIIGGLAIIRDITARRHAEGEVQKSKSLYQNLVETSHDLIFQCNKKGEFVFLNKAWESTTGYRIEEMLGQHFSRFKKSGFTARNSEIFQKLLEGESLTGYETIYVTKSGEERFLLFNVVPRYDMFGCIVGIQGTAFDLTEHKLAERALEELNRELETTVERLIVANRELADFAHIAAHDLRTPLRGIGSLAGIVSAEYRDKLDEHGRELLNMLVARASRMYEQIGSILEYSEIGRIEEKKRKVNLNKLIEAITAAIAPPKNVEIQVTGNLPTLICNETRLAQVFRNLLDNAVKHMDKPEGWIRIDCVEDDHFWKFSVADNGSGIEEKYFKKIFQIFQTLVSRDETEAKGIGLSVVKKIVEISGGTIWVESKVGEGTTFFFTLPKQEIGASI